MSVTVVSFYTPNADYPASATRLAIECEALGVPFRIVERPDLGGYLENCRQKPYVIRDLLTLGPVLWVDVDGSVLKPLDGLPLHADWALRRKPATHSRTWHVHVAFVNATAGGLAFLNAWCDALGAGSDEEALNRLWGASGFPGVGAELAPEYGHIGAAEEGTIVLHRISDSPAKRAAMEKLGL